jgi:predicted Rossmann fold nucleotide-binding protein DprA/Smf involved in DNA uptake
VSISDRSFILLLALTPGMGGRSVSRVLARNQLLQRTSEEFLSLSPEAMREEYRLSAKAALNLTEDQAGRRRAVGEIEERLAALNVKWITSVDSRYPRLIEEMDPDPPGVLFLYGNEKLLEAKTFCILSSRHSSPADLDLVERLCEEAVLNSEVLTTGHDRNTYQRSAVVPLRWGSPRILCLDRGFFQVLGQDLRQEAFRAARLWRYEFDPTTDLAVSPFRPFAGYIGINNQVRDRLVGCLSRRLDFINIGEGGNMEKIAKMALKASRPVRVSDRTLGYRRFEALGAQVIRS